MILPGGRSARAARAGQYLLQFRLELQLQLQRRAANKTARPCKRARPQLLAFLIPAPPSLRSAPSKPRTPEEAVRARHLISTSTIVVLHYTGSNILNGATQSGFSARSRSRARDEQKSRQSCAARIHACACTCTHMRAYARTYEAARTYKYTLAKSIPSVAKVVRYPPGENGFYLNVM